MGPVVRGLQPEAPEEGGAAARRARGPALGLIGFALLGSLLGCLPSSDDVGAPPPSDPVLVDPTDQGFAPTDRPDAGEPPGSPTPTESGEPMPSDGPDDALARFQRDCEQGVQDWREAQVDYPSELSVRLDESFAYNAAVDVRDAPLPPDEVIEATPGSAAAEQVLVKCTVAARLVPVGDALDVDAPSSSSVEGWVPQEFTPAGVVEWSWTVSAVDPVDQVLRLELRPAIVSIEDDAAVGDLDYGSGNQASFVTDVHVEATALQRTAYWFDENWKLIAGIAAVVGAGILALVGWLTHLRKEARALRDA